MDPRITSIVILSLSWLAFKLIRIGRRDKQLPPGPPTIPLLGNLHILPLKFPFLKFTEWAKVYGGIFSLKVANGTIIVVSDMGIVKELLDDRSSETSSRPALYAVDVITGGNHWAMVASDNHIWQMGRKAIQPLISPQAVQAHLPIAEAETAQLLYDILHEPEELLSHISRSNLSFITSVIFGKAIPRHDSPDAILFREYVRHWSETLSPKSAPVDLVPLLRYVPERWAPWKQLWRETQRLQRSLYYSFLESAENNIKSGIRTGAYIENILDRQGELGLTREMIAYIGGVMIDGGAETIVSFLQTLILCLMRSPASLRKAQEEIDIIVGAGRIPVYSDIQALPYVQAVIKETHRFRPVVPAGVPHATLNDIQYRGYTIPKGAPIFLNTWGIFHDPDIFDRPDEFWPERYLLNPDGTKSGHSKDYTIRASLPFGSGKRLCPGMNLANTNSTLAVMRLLWAFNFAPIDDLAPHDQPATWNVEHEYNDGVTFNPKPFQCKVTPRSEEKIKIIEYCCEKGDDQVE